MCFRISLNKKKEEIEKRFKLNPSDMILSEYFHVFGFSHPVFPVISSENELSAATWGLVPFWVKNAEQAKDISNKTLNARSETIFEKPSFREAVKSRRCIVPVDGFYETHELNGKKYPCYIYKNNKDIFGLAGIWDVWTDPLSGKKTKSFSIITTQANEFMEKIHNTKKRMPVILPAGNEKTWLSDLSEKDIKKMFQTDNKLSLKAYTVGKILYSKEPVNSPEVQKKVSYDALVDF